MSHYVICTCCHFLVTCSLSVFGRFTECDDGYFGANCTQECHCDDGDICAKQNGQCPALCAAGWNGTNCQAGIIDLLLTQD